MSSYNILLKKALDTYYNHLNDMQRQAVYQIFDPLLILAGAGSGKTTVLINRIEYMIRFGNVYLGSEKVTATPEEIAFLEEYIKTGQGNAIQLAGIIAEHPIDPWKILAITFTNKAAGELKERLLQALGVEAESIQASTFHSLCVRILRRESQYIGYDNSFTIYDTDDSLRVIKDGLKQYRIDDKTLPPRSILTAISRAKDDLTTPAELLRKASGDYRNECIAKVYEYYQTVLKNANALDFDDIIVVTVRLFQNNPERLDYYQNRYQYIMVDEYQDTNQAQYLLVSLLAAKKQNLCVVGDDDQSIYKFRGATIENILSFEKQFTNAKVIRLEQNYRSTQNILSAANAVIENNTERKGKNLWTSQGDGEPIYHVRLNDELQEARFIADSILKGIEAGGTWSNHAILYRMNAQSNAIERALAQRTIPYRIIGGLRFYERKEIKDITAYLNLINNHADNLRFMRVINEPKRGIGTATTTTIQEISNTVGESYFEVASHSDHYAPIANKSKGLISFTNMIDRFSEMAEETSLPNLLDAILQETGYLQSLKAQGNEGIPRIENVMELKSNMITYEEQNDESSLSGFLEEIALYTDLDNYDGATDTVVLMTVHSAKGLEFPIVFLLGMDEGVFPGRNAQNFPEELEEERRLAYVAITRAKRQLIITGADRRMLFGQTMWGRPSRFVREIPTELINLQDATTSTSTQEKKQTKEDRTVAKSIGVGKDNKGKISGDTYTVGERVQHKIFGEGLIMSVSPMGNDTLLEVEFTKAGIKRVMANFANLVKL